MYALVPLMQLAALVSAFPVTSILPRDDSGSEVWDIPTLKTHVCVPL